MNNSKVPLRVPLRVDFAGGWLDVPRLSRVCSFIVNCTITPMVSLGHWDYKLGSGLGGSAARAMLDGKDAIESELNNGVGWQDPAVIEETGLCVWRSGREPVLECKVNPDFLKGKMALYWTGKRHNTFSIVNNKRDYEQISCASIFAKRGVYHKDEGLLWEAVNQTYRTQLEHEMMSKLPSLGEKAKRYSGSGHGGYALYMFEGERPDNSRLIPIEPYMRFGEGEY